MIRLSITFLTFLLITAGTFAQTNNGYISVGLSAGFTNYKGDMSGLVNSLRYTRPGFGIEGAYRFHSHVGGRLTFFQGWRTEAGETERFTEENTARHVLQQTAEI